MRPEWLVSALSPVNHKQRIISGLKTNFNLFPSYSIYKSLNHMSLFSSSFCSFFFYRPQLSVKYFTKKPTHLIFHTMHQSLSESQNHIHNLEMQTQKHSTTCFGAYLYCAGTRHGNLHPVQQDSRKSPRKKAASVGCTIHTGQWTIMGVSAC